MNKKTKKGVERKFCPEIGGWCMREKCIYWSNDHSYCVRVLGMMVDIRCFEVDMFKTDNNGGFDVQ